ncbi:MAG: hypothetical protein D6768_05200 [Chloroflexi bacterium]|nr:MAG: hypothetical protein D6768_05200 [Chloroflexota bacterium]
MAASHRYLQRVMPVAVPVAQFLAPLPLIFAGILDILNPKVAALAGLTALAPWLLKWARTGRVSRPLVVGIPLTVLAVTAVVSLQTAYYAGNSLPTVLTLLGCIALFATIVNTNIPPRKLAAGLALIAAILAVYFVTQYAYFPYPAENEPWQRPITALALATGAILPNVAFFVPHVNGVAAFLQGALLLNLALVRGSQNRQRFFWLAVFVLLGYALLITGSRGSWLGLAVALFIWGMLWLSVRVKRVGVAVVIGGGLATLALLWALLTFSSLAQAAQSRFNLYLSSLYLLADYPFTGIGPGKGFGLIYSRYQLLINHVFLTYPHNLYLTVGLSFGLPGLLALLWLMVNFFRFVIQVELAAAPSPQKMVFRAAWLAVVAQFTHGLLDATQFAGELWAMPMLFALLGLAILAGHTLHPSTKTVPAKIRWAVAGGLAILLLLAGGLFQQQLRAAWYANLGAVAQTRADFAPALSEDEQAAFRRQAAGYFHRALQIAPHQPTAHLRLGLLALADRKFETAKEHLQQAYAVQPHNPAVLKALGLTYTWLGQPDQAEALFRQRSDLPAIKSELDTWGWWWQEKYRRTDLAKQAKDMAQRLSVE